MPEYARLSGNFFDFLSFFEICHISHRISHHNFFQLFRACVSVFAQAILNFAAEQKDNLLPISLVFNQQRGSRGTYSELCAVCWQNCRKINVLYKRI